MATHQPHEMYYENQAPRSPGSLRHQQQPIHRQPSRQFDGYGPLPPALYTAEDHAAVQQTFVPRYDERLQQPHNPAFPNPMNFMNNPWNSYGAAPNNSLAAALGATARGKTHVPGRGRAGLPPNWLDNSVGPMSPYASLSPASMGHGGMRPDGLSSDLDEELIPTAIVIKNIPFAVKKEQLVQLMTEIGLPLPYAFNYHFDNGIFRGLAFANFSTADETAVVIEALNHYELLGRKLRVEYKKMLPLAERERIEREKRIKRGQLEEQHQPLRLTQQPSVGSMSSGQIPRTSPSPVGNQNHKLAALNNANTNPSYSLTEEIEYDLNDPTVLEFYTKLALFKADPSRETTTMPPTLTPAQRRIVHTLAHKMGLAHVSKGNGEQRSVHIFRVHGDGPNMSPPVQQLPNSHPTDTHRRALNRAATTDFAEVRGDGFYGTLRGQSSGLLGFPDSPSGLATHNLRAAKSYADLRSYTPSPVPSTASFPATLNTNFARFASEYAHTAASNPNLAATAANAAARDDALLVNGVNNMAIGAGFGPGGSPRSIRNAWDRDAPGPIGGHRSFTTNFEEPSRERIQGLPSRQPRGPMLERGPGFNTSRPRQNGHSGRGSDDLSSQSGKEILVEQ